MTVFTIDPRNAGILPEGDYNAFISKIEIKESQKGNQYANIEFTLKDNEEHNDRKVYGSFSPNTSFFLNLLTAAGHSYPEDQPFQVDVEKILGGKQLCVRVIHEDYMGNDNKKKTSAKVGDVMPYNDSGSGAVESEDMPW